MEGIQIEEEESNLWLEPFENSLLEDGTKGNVSDQEEQGVGSSIQLTPSPPLSRIGVNTDKAGMEGLDKSKINQIIVEASKGSRYYKKELEREKVLSQRIKKMLDQLKEFTPSQLQKAEREADADLKQLESKRDLSRIIVHIDMDAFYAAVEMRDNPSLKDVPMAVGGSSMLSTSNYHARRFGVRAAMPGFIGRRLCPNLVIVKPNFDKYRQVGEEVQSILKDYDPDFCPMGLDESYLDITEYVNEVVTGTGMSTQSIGTSPRTRMSTQSIGMSPTAGTSPGNSTLSEDEDVDAQTVQSTLSTDSPTLEDNSSKVLTCSEHSWHGRSHYYECIQRVVSEIRHKVEAKTSLTASAGIGPNKMLAKISSNFNKPNGQYFLEPSEDKVMEFVRKLPIRKVSGIGKVTERILNALGIETCQDLYDKRGTLKMLFSETSTHNFFRVALGIGSTRVSNEWERKSLSTERTFSDTSSPDELLEKCSILCRSLAKEAEEENVKGRTVTLKIKTACFEVKQRSNSTDHPVGSYSEIHQIARGLLLGEMKACSPSLLNLRLMGVRLSSLERPRVQTPVKRSRTNTLEQYFLSRRDSSLKEDDGHDGKKRRKQDDSDIEQVGVVNSPNGLEESRQEETVQCSVCSKYLSKDNVKLNQHIDECLNMLAISTDSTLCS